MESIHPRSTAIARLHLQSAIRRDGEPNTIYRTSNAHKQAMMTEALDVLGFDVNAGSEDFEVPPTQMPHVAELLVLTKAGQRKLEVLLSDSRGK